MATTPNNAYIATVFNRETYSFDIEIGNGQLVTDSGLGTAILNHLFSSSITVGPFVNWWGNSLVGATPLGSNLPNLLRGVRSGNTSILATARDYVKAAMQAFLDAGLITSLSVPLPTWQRASGINNIVITISITLAGANAPQLLKFGVNPASGAYFAVE